MKNPIKMGWFGGTPIFGNPHLGESVFFRDLVTQTQRLEVGDQPKDHR